MRRIRPAAWLAAIGSLFVAAVTALAYTSAQAEAGQQVFTTICAGCHGAALEGGVGPALLGPAFRTVWANAAALLSYVSQNMPLGAPGSLTREQYQHVVAYLLRRNGISPGREPLGEEAAARIALR
ncbi:MAG: cytochrome c [Anaerolineae bacterium]|nr:cytochrome c [Anaerolineae bacterium]